MAEPEKKLPDENASSHENEDNLDENKKESSEHADISKEFHEAQKRANVEGTKDKLHSLRGNVEEGKADKLLDVSGWLGKKEKTSEKDAYESGSNFGSSLETKHVEHFSGIEPNRRIGEKPFHDVRDFGIGVSDSVITTTKLGGHIVVDTFKFLRHPVEETTRTKAILDNNVAQDSQYS